MFLALSFLVSSSHLQVTQVDASPPKLVSIRAKDVPFGIESLHFKFDPYLSQNIVIWPQIGIFKPKCRNMDPSIAENTTPVVVKI